MSGYYSNNPNIPPQYYNVDPNAMPNPNHPSVSPMMAPDGPYAHAIPESPMYHVMPGPFVPYPDPQVQQGYIPQYEDVSAAIDPSQGGNGRVRRRPGPADHVKHRRTRSGCYTCRQRRVKCDEAHPICERCRKGNRECVYPEPNSTSKSNRSGSKVGKPATPEESSPEDHDNDVKVPLATILDDGEEYVEEEDMDPDIRGLEGQETSTTPPLTVDRSPSPNTDASCATHGVNAQLTPSRKSSFQSGKLAGPGKLVSTLPKDIQFYLNYFKQHISLHHYSMKRDSGNFLKTVFLQEALQYEPLLYAVVGYAAYFHTLTQPDGRISTFLQYYNKSVTRLRYSITKSKKQRLATFLTILQLASIEEVLGDWVNLMGHQKAAYELLTRLYTPETIVQSDLHLKILLWYIRFDLFVGFQSGGEAVLSREWYVATHEHYKKRSAEDPDELNWRYEERFAYSRLVAKDTHDLFLRKGKGVISDTEFMDQLPVLDARMRNLENDIDPVLLDPVDLVETFPGSPERDPDSIVNPFEPNLIWDKNRWTSNFLLLDMYGIMFMHNVSMAMALRRPFAPETSKMALRSAQLFEAVTNFPGAVPGVVIEAQATMAIAVIFLPKDAKTVQWIRETFVRIESAGYIYSDVLRNRMLEACGVGPSDWWLPNDEGCPRIIRSIKNFIRDRATAPKDQVSDDLREMRGIFSTLIISDSPLEDHLASPATDHTLSATEAPSTLDDAAVYTSGSPEYEHDTNYKDTSADVYGPGHLVD